jgi:hypothetical protein
MEPKRYRAECVKEIYWGGKTYRRGEHITVMDGDVETLRDAGVIGDIKRITAEVETAVITAPENTARNYRRKP